MATRKAANKSSKTTRQTAPSRPTNTTKVRTVTAKSTRAAKPTTTARKPVAASVAAKPASRIDSNAMNIVLAELIGTFILTLVAVLSFQNELPLYLGLVFALLVMSLGAISGAHLNPAVTFGFWATNRLKSVMVPFYWAAQLLGAMAAVVVLNLVSGNKLGLDFGHFNEFSWSMFTVEMVGMAVFMFGLVAVFNRLDLTAGSKALGAGLSFSAGLLVAGALFANVQSGVDPAQVGFETDEATGQQRLTNVPRELSVKAATINPAIALASTEQTDSQLQGGQAAEGEALYSRLGWEVILATLLGAAVGGNLARLINYRLPRN